MTRRKLVVICLPCGLAAGGLLAGFLAWERREFSSVVRVKNVGDTPLLGVTLHFADVKHPVGDIGPGAAVTARVVPAYDSHLEVEFTGPSGKRRRLEAGGYFTPNLRTIIEVEMDSSAVRSCRSPDLR
jgi:hypothetical protein